MAGGSESDNLACSLQSAQNNKILVYCYTFFYHAYIEKNLNLHNPHDAKGGLESVMQVNV